MASWLKSGTTLLMAVGVLMLCCERASADDADCAQQQQNGLKVSKASIIVPQQGQRCYGVEEEQNPITQKFFKAIGKGTDTETLVVAVQRLATDVEADKDLVASVREQFAKSARQTAVAMSSGIAVGEAQTATAVWKLNNGQVKAVPGLDLIKLLDTDCPTIESAASPACQGAIERAKSWLRARQLVEVALTRYSAPAFAELSQRSKVRLAMWHAYRDDGLPQYPWEWLLNSARLDRADKSANGRLRDTDDQPIGPMKTPTDQLVLLHPGVGLEYRGRSDQASTTGSATTPIVYLELIGRYRWSSDESTGAMLGGSGVSLVATYADRSGDTDVGYGILFHTRRTKAYTFGITRSGHATSIIFNADVAEFFKDKLPYSKKVDTKSGE